jgi:hypothetical protein
MNAEPDYTLTIIQGADGWIVCEGGERISKPIKDRAEAEWWLKDHRLWHQPKCCVCGSAVTRPDDPWDAYSVSCSSGPDWMHKSCMEKFEYWAAEEAKKRDPEDRGPHQIAPMDELDAAWAVRKS